MQPSRRAVAAARELANAKLPISASAPTSRARIWRDPHVERTVRRAPRLVNAIVHGEFRRLTDDSKEECKAIEVSKLIGLNPVYRLARNDTFHDTGLAIGNSRSVPARAATAEAGSLLPVDNLLRGWPAAGFRVKFMNLAPDVSRNLLGTSPLLCKNGLPESIPAKSQDIMPSLSLRINLDPEGRIGPGKIELLEQIATLGSIAAAGRAMGMSYRRAWELVEELNAIFGKPLVERQVGGKHGGGARLTLLGLALISRFRAIERAAAEVAHIHLAALQVEVDRVEESAEQDVLASADI